MPSTLRSTPSSSIAKPSTLLQRKQKMTVKQTYYLAHVARAKLSKEAAKSDHDLRLLVGHANLLDGLMLDLAEVEREQENWFNQTVKGASSNSNDRHVQWAGESLPAVTEDYEEDSDDSSDSDDDEAETTLATVRQAMRPSSITVSKPTAVASTTAIVDDEDDDDDDMAEDFEVSAPELRLRRTPSHSSPPELMEESESESESESDSDMPPSPPPAAEIEVFSEKQRRDAFTSSKPQVQQGPQEAFYEDGFYLPQRQPVSVY